MIYDTDAGRVTMTTAKINKYNKSLNPSNTIAEPICPKHQTLSSPSHP